MESSVGPLSLAGAEVTHPFSHSLDLGLNDPPPDPSSMVPSFTLNQTLIPNSLIHKSFGLLTSILAWTPIALFPIQWEISNVQECLAIISQEFSY